MSMETESNNREGSTIFWDNHWKKADMFRIDEYNFNEFKALIDKIDNMQLQNKHVLDIGCGRGEISVYLAKKGAFVTAIDVSSEAVAFVKGLAEYNSVIIDSIVMDAFDIHRLNKKFDLVIGKYVLHHIEPFEVFVPILNMVINKDGMAIFYENNATNKVLMFFRNNLVGKFGVPKYGDANESPFSSSEIKMLEKEFGSVKITYPRFVFFGLLGPYIFKSNKVAFHLFNAIDCFVFKLRCFNRYSYVQILEFGKNEILINS